MAASDAVIPADQGDSLGADAWRRLRKNRMAMIGLWITVFMTLVAALADVLMPFDPTREQLWVGPLPPNTEILDLRNEMRFRVGSVPGEADVPEPAYRRLGDGESFVLSFDVAEEDVERLAISMFGPVVRGIRVFPAEGGVRQVPRLELPDGTRLRERDPLARLDVRLLEREEPWIDVSVLEVEEEAPPGFPVRGGSYVLALESISMAPGAQYELTVAIDGGGRVTELAKDGVAISGDDVFVLRPQHVLDVRIDGARLSHTHILGTDLKGRDSFSRLIYGSRISLLVGITATLVSLLIGVFYGALAGYVGGKVDGAMMRAVDVLYGIPYLFLVILMLVAFGRSIIILFIALGAVQWLTMARIVRGQVLSLREKEFIDAAITLGTRPWQILTRHLIPNTLGVVVVYTTLTVPAVILQESFLSFLGLTVELGGRPVASWGALVNDGREALGLAGENWWLLLWPSIAMSATLFSLNFLGDGLRDALDPQQRGRT